MKRSITPSDILSPAEFAKIRLAKRDEMTRLKKNRRVHLGPDATLYFENYDTLWWQIQEMLRIEKGGDEQITDELLAYNPLIPQGQELVATFMIEIDDPVRRSKVLAQLGGIEETLLLRFDGHSLRAQPEHDTERTTAEGKTSAIHFIRWIFTREQIRDFSEMNQDIIIESTHPQYTYKTVMPESIRQALAADFV